MLNAHPNIFCGGETFLLRAAAQFLQSDTIADGINYGVLGGLQAAGIEQNRVTEKLRNFVFGFFDESAAEAGKARWASKTAVDSFYVRELEQVFCGHVKFVCVLRHGLDTACSMRDLCDANGIYIKELHRYVARHPAPLEAFVHAWSDVTQSLLHLADRRKGDTILIRYEDLVSGADAVLAELFGFLDEEFDNKLIDEAFVGAQVQGLGDWKTYGTRGIETTSVGRYRSLSEATISRLAAIANPVLEMAGYDVVPVSAQPDPEAAMRRYEMELTLKAARKENPEDVQGSR
jgi:hypothetical protein